MTLLFLFILGSIIGSFLGALTWRWPKNISLMAGRSRCFHCNHTIRWYDNIPVISYIILGGICRDCKKPIPKRDFFIEFGVALLFPIIYLFLPNIGMNIVWFFALGQTAALIAALIIASLLAAIFIIDFEHQYIPDSLVFLILAAVLGSFLIASNPLVFNYLAAGAGTAVFLLILHLATLGRGMGLGDVKLALALGTALGFPLALVWMFGSFVLGAVVGLVLIVLQLAKFKQKIAFGPFLIVGFLIAAVAGNNILALFSDLLL